MRRRCYGRASTIQRCGIESRATGHVSTRTLIGRADSSARPVGQRLNRMTIGSARRPGYPDPDYHGPGYLDHRGCPAQSGRREILLGPASCRGHGPAGRNHPGFRAAAGRLAFPDFLDCPDPDCECCLPWMDAPLMASCRKQGYPQFFARTNELHECNSSNPDGHMP